MIVWITYIDDYFTIMIYLRIYSKHEIAGEN